MPQIASEAEARVALGLTSAITDDERAAINLFLPAAEKAVVDFIGYDPVQREHTRYFPRTDPSGGIGFPDSGWDVHSSGRSAIRYYPTRASGMFPTLQLDVLPVRAVSDLRVDYDARHGQQTNAFAATTKRTPGQDYWTEDEAPNYCPSGCVFSRSTWPIEPGTVRVTFTAGYSPDEMNGRVETTGVDSDGYYNRVGVSANPLKRAVLLTLTTQMQKWAALRKSETTGFVPGPKQSERLGDYQYSLGGDGGKAIAGLVVELPAPAAELAEPFRHFGLYRL